MQLLFCDTLLSVRIIYFLKIAVNVLRFGIPILLIIKITIDVYKGLLHANDEKQEILKKASTRIIAAILIFLVPTFVGVLFSLIGENESYQSNFLSCYNKADSNLIAVLEKNEENRLSEEEAEKNKQDIANYANYQAYTENMTENSNNVTSNYSSNLTDLNKQNGVYIKNGTFYIPNSGSGKNCPSNPESEGYNNKYGYNNYFWSMLSKMVADSEKAGYKLKPNNQGCRSYSSQVSLKQSKGNIAATPGLSLHGFGIASDVTFYKNMSDACGSSRTMTNCPGMKWAHEHAKDYGLRFINNENWHIQPINYERYK